MELLYHTRNFVHGHLRLLRLREVLRAQLSIEGPRRKAAASWGLNQHCDSLSPDRHTRKPTGKRPRPGHDKPHHCLNSDCIHALGYIAGQTRMVQVTVPRLVKVTPAHEVHC